MAFGNQKPKHVAKYEKLLWQAIAQVAAQKLDGLSAMHAFFGEIDWEELDQVPQHEKRIFKVRADLEISGLESGDLGKGESGPSSPVQVFELSHQT